MRSLGSTNLQTLLLPALVVCALLTTLASSPARGECPLSTEEGTDRPGSDLEFIVTDLAGCRQACAAKASCKAYTLVHSTHKCFLKSSVPAAVASDCCTSGAKGVWRSGPYSISTWAGQTLKKPLGSSRTHICVLTRVSGKFVGGGESLRVVVRRVGNTHHFRWVLEAVSHQEGETVPVNGTARCFCKEDFVANGPERMISPPFEATDLFPIEDTWNGDAATFISGVNGHLRGGGEHAHVFQSSDGSKPSELRIGSSAGDLKAWAHSFFAGTPGSGTPAKFFETELTTKGGEFTLNHVGFTLQSAVMARTEEAMCYLILVKGKFDNKGDFAEIVPQTVNGEERWVLQAQRATEVPWLGAAPQLTGEIFVAARCYRRNQM